MSPYLLLTTHGTSYSKAVLSAQVSDGFNPIPTIKTPIQGHYGNASYNTFSKFYEKTYDFYRTLDHKFIAIPKALYAGVIKTSCNLFHLIFVDIREAYSGNGSPLKLRTLRIIRDLEESAGWIITLFHDKLGSYIVEESLFQKTCYSALEESLYDGEVLPINIISEASSRILSRRLGTPSFKSIYKATSACFERENITLEQLLAMSNEERLPILEKHNLTHKFNILTQNKSESTTQALKTLTLNDLYTYSEYKITSPITFALLSDTDFLETALTKVEVLGPFKLGFIKSRLNFISATTEQIDLSNIDFSKITLEELKRLSGRVLDECFDKLSNTALMLLTTSQICSMNLENITESRLLTLLPFNTSTQEHENISSFSSVQLNSIIHKLTNHFCLQLCLGSIPDDKLAGLNLSGLPREGIEILLQGKRSMSCLNPDETTRRLALLTESQRAAINDKLPDRYRSTSRDT